MEPRKYSYAFNSGDKPADQSNTRDSVLTRRRLDSLIAANAEFDHRRGLYKTVKEEFEASMMNHPLSPEAVFSYFGLMLGIFPPAAIFLKTISSAGDFRREDAWVIALMILVNFVSAAVGFVTGKLVGKVVVRAERYPWWAALFLMPFIGLGWGVATGGSAGVFVFIVGAIFGALMGGVVGAAALPVFALFHLILKRGDKMERSHFLPIALGITLAICGFIFGYPS